jgi:hypothetical protein
MPGEDLIIAVAQSKAGISNDLKQGERKSGNEIVISKLWLRYL